MPLHRSFRKASLSLLLPLLLNSAVPAFALKQTETAQGAGVEELGDKLKRLALATGLTSPQPSVSTPLVLSGMEEAEGWQPLTPQKMQSLEYGDWVKSPAGKVYTVRRFHDGERGQSNQVSTFLQARIITDHTTNESIPESKIRQGGWTFQKGKGTAAGAEEKVEVVRTQQGDLVITTMPLDSGGVLAKTSGQIAQIETVIAHNGFNFSTYWDLPENRKAWNWRVEAERRHARALLLLTDGHPREAAGLVSQLQAMFAKAPHLPGQVRPIVEVLHRIGVRPEEAEFRGDLIAKIDAEPVLHRLADRQQGKLVIVTGITPTPAGEGKTTTSIGLVDGLARLGVSVMGDLREPSLGPVLGAKGTATGAGRSQLYPGG